MKIAIIPARGGSKRIPKKNIKLFHGKPIIAYSIELAIKSELFDFVYVSTDDAEIESIAQRFGAKVHKRSGKNSDDFATTSDVIQEVIMDLESLHGNIDLICCIYATTPLLEVTDLIAAHRTFQESESDIVLAATPFSFPPQRGFTLFNHEINLVNPDQIQSRSQDLKTQYHDVGAFYFINPTKFKISKNIWAGKMHAHILPESKIQDIDTEEDWKMAELKYALLISEQNDNASFNEWTTKNYKCLTKQVYSKNEFEIVPIRSTDRHEIRKWRNEQVYHLRQNGLLSENDQDAYYQNVVSKLFEEEKPNQLLFSFLKNNVCIGYGGLVHINWIDRHAEISFIMDTALEKAYFHVNWLTYLSLIEQVAFENLNFHKLYTYAFDLRPHLYEALLASNFREAARLKEHCFFDNRYIDVVIHSKINQNLTFRKPRFEDAQLYFDWANDEDVRSNSFSHETISFESHIEWFSTKLQDPNCFMYLFQNDKKEYIGQVRIQKQSELSSIIGVSVDINQRGKGFAHKIIEMASNDFLSNHKNTVIDAYIKQENNASAKAFEKAGFTLREMTNYENHACFLYFKQKV